MERKEYGLFTVITLIIGIVIGSGIFFKSDNILVYTEGSILKGVIIFAICSLGIVFGSLSIAVLAQRTKNAGGIVAYAEEFVSKKVACAFGWFQAFIYFPAISSIIGWVFAIYFCMLFGIESTNINLLIISSIAIILIYILNSISANMGGQLQNISTIIKLIPMVIIAFAGIFMSGNTEIIFSSNTNISNSIGWLGAIAPVAFSYEGWIVSTSVSHEVKNSEKTLPFALVFSSIFILVIYVLYFVGISVLVGPETIIAVGDEHVNLAAQKVFGDYGAKIIVTFIVISVLGGLNGLVLGFIRVPYSLSTKNMFPASEKIAVINEKFKTPLNSAIVAFVINIVWILINYVVQEKGLLPNSDISEAPIVASYILYIILYVTVIIMYKKGNHNISFVKGIIFPGLAIIGAIIIISCGLVNPVISYYMIVCIAFMLLSVLFMKNK